MSSPERTGAAASPSPADEWGGCSIMPQSWVTTATALALGRLARRAGTTQRTVLEQLIQDADRAVTQGMNDDEFDHYFALQCNNE